MNKTVVAIMFFFSLNSWAANLSVIVKDQKGKLVSDALVYATPDFELKAAPANQVIVQKDKKFIPTVSGVQIGGSISFPNQDDTDHSLYSVSKAKKFTIPLYKKNSGKPPNVIFDKLGTVVLGCNIHDWMVAYVHVVPTPYFKATQKGKAKLAGLQAGTYQVKVWHPKMKGAERKKSQSITLSSDQKATLNWEIRLKRKRKRR